MATAQQQARFRARDSKTTIQTRLSPQAVAELDRLVSIRGASGRAAVLETLLVTPTDRAVLSLAGRHLRQSGATEIHGTDSTGALVEVRRQPPKAPTWLE